MDKLVKEIISGGRYNYNWASQLLESLNFLLENNHISRQWVSEMGGQILEIGSFEGLGSNILFEYLINGTGNRITCIDPFPAVSPFPSIRRLGSGSDTIDTYANFLENTRRFSRQLRVMRNTSDRVSLPNNYYSFIYIDGDHSKEAVYRDGRIAYDLIRPGGIILFDDYGIIGQDTKMGIKKFIDEYHAECQVIYKRYQLAVRVNKGIL